MPDLLWAPGLLPSPWQTEMTTLQAPLLRTDSRGESDE
jgi:hypothetical protein